MRIAAGFLCVVVASVAMYVSGVILMGVSPDTPRTHAGHPP